MNVTCRQCICYEVCGKDQGGIHGRGSCIEPLPHARFFIDVLVSHSRQRLTQMQYSHIYHSDISYWLFGLSFTAEANTSAILHHNIILQFLELKFIIDVLQMQYSHILHFQTLLFCLSFTAEANTHA